MIALLAESDLDEAINLLPRVRDHPRTRVSAYSAVSRALIEQEESDRAIELGQELPESLRENYYLSLFSQWIRRDMVDLFESLDALPSTDLKSQAAQAILSYWDLSHTTVHDYFSDKQIQEIKAHLTEDASL